MISTQLKALRKESRMTQTELARATGISFSAISAYERGTRIPSPKVMKKLADFYGVSLDYLFGEQETKKETVSREFPNQLPLRRVPIIGKISAGLPNYAFDDPDGYAVYTGDDYKDCIALRINGNSMNAINMPDGAIVIVKLTKDVENGQVAAVRVNGDEATVKRFYRKGNVVSLVPQSTDLSYETQMYDLNNTVIEIIGIVVKIISDVPWKI